MKPGYGSKTAYKEFFKENGYVVVKNAVPKEMCDRTIRRMFEFMGKNPNDREGWYTPATGMDSYYPHQDSGMLPLYQDQTLWDNRMYPTIYGAFAELLGEDKLWVTLDRVNMKPPKRENNPELNQSSIHWDVDTSDLTFPQPIPSRVVQGVLYLADTAPNQGGFQCVPSIFRNLEAYFNNQPKDRDRLKPDIAGHEVIPIPGEAGDLVIWDGLLAHGNGENLSDRLRFAQYISMFPAAPENKELLNTRIDAWRNFKPALPIFPEDPRGWEREHNESPAQLTILGRKLLGIESW
jgi:hypothetical protein